VVIAATRSLADQSLKQGSDPDKFQEICRQLLR
jgi:hypothetical protein